MLSILTLSLSDAKVVAEAARARAHTQGWYVAIAIVDVGGHLVYLERADGTQLGSTRIAEEKARTALYFKRPSKALEDMVLGGRANMLALPAATPIEGGLPLISKGQVVGAVGVSGVLSSQDAQIAQAGAEALHGASSAAQ